MDFIISSLFRNVPYIFKYQIMICLFGSNFFHLAKALATTNSEPEIALIWIHTVCLFVMRLYVPVNKFPVMSTHFILFAM